MVQKWSNSPVHILPYASKAWYCEVSLRPSQNPHKETVSYLLGKITLVISAAESLSIRGRASEGGIRRSEVRFLMGS